MTITPGDIVRFAEPPTAFKYRVIWVDGSKAWVWCLVAKAVRDQIVYTDGLVKVEEDQ